MLATEILENAEDIADLMNSDFMSGKQKNRILNENFRAIYQKIVNHGDRYLLQELLPDSSGRYLLPDDFYQLHSITASNGTIQVPRKIVGQGDYTSGYTIEKDEIKVIGFHNVKILYYPKPEFLFTNTEEILRPSYAGVPYRQGYPEVPAVEAVHRDAREGRQAFFVPAVEAQSRQLQVIGRRELGNDLVKFKNIDNTMFNGNACSSGNTSEQIQTGWCVNVDITTYVNRVSQTEPYTIIDSVGREGRSGTGVAKYYRFGSTKTSTFYTFDDITALKGLTSDLAFANAMKNLNFPLFLNNGAVIGGRPHPVLIPNEFSFFYPIRIGENLESVNPIVLSEIMNTEYSVVDGVNKPPNKNKWVRNFYFTGNWIKRRATKNHAFLSYKLATTGASDVREDISELRFCIYDFQTQEHIILKGGIDFDETKNWWFIGDGDDLILVYHDMQGNRKKRIYNTVTDDTTDYQGIDLDTIKVGSNLLWIDGRIYWIEKNDVGIKLDNGEYIGSSTDWIYSRIIGGYKAIVTQWQSKLQAWNVGGGKLGEMTAPVQYGAGMIGDEWVVIDKPNNIAISQDVQYLPELVGLPEINVPAVEPVEEVDLPALEGRPEIPEIPEVPAVEEVVDTLNTDLTMRNNLFFDVLAYMCALQFKQKQNADTTAIKEQLAEKMEVFFDTMDEDDFEDLRIRNIY